LTQVVGIGLFQRTVLTLQRAGIRQLIVLVGQEEDQLKQGTRTRTRWMFTAVLFVAGSPAIWAQGTGTTTQAISASFAAASALSVGQSSLSLVRGGSIFFQLHSKSDCAVQSADHLVRQQYNHRACREQFFPGKRTIGLRNHIGSHVYV